MPTLRFKDTIKLEDRATISGWLGDSQAWANTAVMLDEHGRAKPGESVLNADHNQLNVAHVSMGMAFELALKALAVSERRGLSGKHEAVINYGTLSPSSQNKVAQAIKKHSGMSVQDYLEYLDERMCHPYRKYWMVDKRGSGHFMGFTNPNAIPSLSIAVAAKIHGEIADMVGENAFQNWQRGQRVIM